MGRAPIPGGPQRVAAHVVPRAKPSLDPEDEASTALAGSHWEEDEHSTTVEPNQSDKPKLPLPLPPTKPGAPNGANGNITQTGAGLDDHTVDDGHAREVLSAITPIRPEGVARLSITQGNDAGQEIEIRPGKTYTIGRAIDNDIVLTDISVSRKHFDVKHEDGAWVIVDRGSGNGTVVNGNLEDNPFMLATGDVIEIGNTVFKFEQPNGTPRESLPTYDLEDEEPSTVLGKPLRDDAAALAAPRAAARPKTLPPPSPSAPLRAANQSSPPPLGYPPAQGLPNNGYGQVPSPASTLPMAQMANRPPLPGLPGVPNLPGMPPPGMGPPGMAPPGMAPPGARTMVGDAMGMPLSPGMPPPGPIPTTLPGQSPPLRGSFPYPQASEIPPHSAHAQMLLIQQTNARRGDGSTAHVPPVPYTPSYVEPARGSGGPQLTRRTKLVIAGVAIAVLTGILTAAIVKSGGSSKPSAAAKNDKTDPKATKPDNKLDPKSKQQPTVEPIKQDNKVAAVTPTKDQAKQEAAKQEAAKQEAAKQEAAKQEAAKQEAAKQEAAKQEAAKQEAARQEAAKQEQAKKEAAKKQEPKREASRDKKREREREREPARRDPAPKRVATADVSDAEDKADELYRDKNFNGAAKVLADAAKSVDDSQAKSLRLKSDQYVKLGKSYSQGTAPAAKPNEAYEFLRQASNYDRNLGNAFDGDIQTRIAAVAPKAAVAYLAKQQYKDARNALITAKQLGSTDSNLQLVKQKLEAIAGDLYNEASKEISSNPTAAKEKLRQVKDYVDSKSPWAVKADALLKKS